MPSYPTPGQPAQFKHDPFFSIRFLESGSNQHLPYLVPHVDVLSKKTGAIKRQEWGSESIAESWWEHILKTHTNHKDEPIIEAELLYGGDLVSNNTRVVGAQVLKRWTAEKGEVVLLVPPKPKSVLPADAEDVEHLDATVDPSVAVSAPEHSEDQGHLPDPEKGQTVAPADGTPGAEKVEVPVGSSADKLESAAEESDPATTTVTE